MGVGARDCEVIVERSKFINCLHSPLFMASRNNNKLTKVQTKLRYFNDVGATYTTDLYLDLAQGLSIVNRKLFSQEYCYQVKNITATYTPSPLYDRVIVQCVTAGDTWTVHNAWTKAKALHTEMQSLVLDDMPSIEGKWAEFKVYLDHLQLLAGVAGNRTPIAPNGVEFLPGEWNHSQFVMPQHDVDPVTGEPLAALELYGHILGPDIVLPVDLSRGLIQAYADSRATVQPNAPAVPAAAEDSFYNLLSDSGSQEPELAGVIIAENDQPPYDQLEYVGGAINGEGGQVEGHTMINEHTPNLNTGPFLAQCGLVHVTITAWLGGVIAALPVGLKINVELAKGSYKGINAIPMGQ